MPCSEDTTLDGREAEREIRGEREVRDGLAAGEERLKPAWQLRLACFGAETR